MNVKNRDRLHIGLLMSFGGLLIAGLIHSYILSVVGGVLIVFGTWFISQSLD